MKKEQVFFDLESDLMMSLENLSGSLTNILSGQSSYFKWAVVYAHNAVQTLMCIVLSDVDHRLVLTREARKNGYGDLDNIKWLYERLCNPDFLSCVDSKVMDRDPSTLESIEELQSLRNTFMHSQPVLYVFTKEELVKILIFSMGLIKFLVRDSSRFFLCENPNKILDTIDEKLQNIK